MRTCILVIGLACVVLPSTSSAQSQKARKNQAPATGQELQLAPQAGPSLEETLKWITERVPTIRSPDRIASYPKLTTIAIDDNNGMILTQQEYSDTSELDFLSTYRCNLRALSGALTFNGDVQLKFAGPCRRSICLISHCESPSLSDGETAIIKVGYDSALAEKVTKAFNRLAELMKTLPKPRDNDLF